MMTDLELIQLSVEQMAEKIEDLPALVYPAFFASFSEAEELFGIDTEDAVKNNMLVSLVIELMEYADGKIYPYNVQRWIKDHISYGVTEPMYHRMIALVFDALKQLAGDAWNNETEAAWQAQFSIVSEFVIKIYQPLTKES